MRMLKNYSAYLLACAILSGVWYFMKPDDEGEDGMTAEEERIQQLEAIAGSVEQWENTQQDIIDSVDQPAPPPPKPEKAKPPASTDGGLRQPINRTEVAVNTAEQKASQVDGILSGADAPAPATPAPENAAPVAPTPATPTPAETPVADKPDSPTPPEEPVAIELPAPAAPEEPVAAPVVVRHDPLENHTVLRGKALPYKIVATPGWSVVDGRADTTLAIGKALMFDVEAVETTTDNATYARNAVAKVQTDYPGLSITRQEAVSIDNRSWGRFDFVPESGTDQILLFTHSNGAAAFTITVSGPQTDFAANNAEIVRLVTSFRFPPDNLMFKPGPTGVRMGPQ